MGNGGEFAISFFHDIGLGDDAHPCFAVLAGIVKGGTGNPPGSGIGGNLEIHGHTIQRNAPAAQHILPLGILPVEHPVNALRRDAHRTDVGVQIQLPAQRHIGALHFAAHGGGSGAFQQHITGLDVGKHIRRDALAQRQPVFDGQALNLLDNHLAGLNFIGKQRFQHPLCLGNNDFADAVPVDNADGNGFLLREIHLVGLHIVDAFQLLAQQDGEGIHCRENLPLPIQMLFDGAAQVIQSLFDGLFHYAFASRVYSSRPPASRISFCRWVRLQFRRTCSPVSFFMVTKPVSMPSKMPEMVSLSPWVNLS